MALAMTVAAMAVPMAFLVAVTAVMPAAMLGEGRRRGHAEAGDGDGGDGGEFQDFHIMDSLATWSLPRLETHLAAPRSPA